MMKRVTSIIAMVFFIISFSASAATTIPITQSVHEASWQSLNTGDALEFVPQSNVHDYTLLINADPQCGKSLRCSGFYITCNGIKAHVQMARYPYTNQGAYFCRTSRAITVVNDGKSAGLSTGTLQIVVIN